MSKVLIALDYNPTSQQIAEAGYGLAKAMKAHTVLLYVISDPVYYTSFNYSPIMGFDGFNNVDIILSDTADELMKAAKRFLDETKRSLGNESIESVVCCGEFGITILETAQRLDIDIIVLGAQRKRGSTKILMEGVTEYVLHHSPIPLFIIPSTDNYEMERLLSTVQF